MRNTPTILPTPGGRRRGERHQPVGPGRGRAEMSVEGSYHMKQRRIGTVEVSAIGLGGMPMSIEGRPERERSVATVHAALDAGVTLIDTADAYHLYANEVGHNES